MSRGSQSAAMSSRRRSLRITETLCAAYAALAVATVWLSSYTHAGTLAEPTTTALLVLPTMVVGALIAGKRPDNRLGWLLSSIALTLTLTCAAASYAIASRDGLALPGKIWVAWVSSWLGVYPLFAVFSLTFLWFPSGRPPSSRWRPIEWIIASAIIVASLVYAFMFDHLPSDSFVTEAGAVSIDNPAGIDALAPWADPVNSVMRVVWGLMAAASVASLVVRFYHARGVERKQIKWLAFVALLASVSILVGLGPFPGWLTDIGWVMTPIALTVGTPLAIGIAVLRHGLYDIDRLMNRAAVYGVLSIGLIVLYAGCVVLLQSALNTVTQGSDLAIAASTLVVAALFRPARSRIQRAVDRRFNRARYDAAQTIASFSTRLREETDLDALRVELCDVVRLTMQPASVSLWLRER
jgi:hypothetical protein